MTAAQRFLVLALVPLLLLGSVRPSTDANAMTRAGDDVRLDLASLKHFEEGHNLLLRLRLLVRIWRIGRQTPEFVPLFLEGWKVLCIDCEAHL